jgi:hypothetical protein
MRQNLPKYALLARSKNLQIIQIKTDSRREAPVEKIAEMRQTRKQKTKDL